MDDLSHKSRRQRAILSCNDCRRRKLKCDRLSPCDRCIKGGIQESCAYGTEAHSVASEEMQDRPKKKRRQARGADRSATIEERHTSRIEENGTGRDDQLRPDTAAKQRLEQLERDIALLQQHIPSHIQEPKDQIGFLAQSPELKGIIHSSAVMGMLKGRSFATQFYGPSSLVFIIAHFPELRSYMAMVFADSKARRLSQDIKASEDQARLMKQNHRLLSVSSLRSLLPDRPTVDVILKKYFDTFETTLRIIHVPSFKVAYENYWQKDCPDNTDMDALILAILACTICTSTHTTPRYTHIGSSFHSKAWLWVRACAVWLKRQSNKRRTLATLQVRCLRVLALGTASIKSKEYHQEVQALVALMRAAGMHREPSIFGTRCSIFEGEMRRRLWATVMEIELQASIDRGTSSMLSGLDYDCAPPRNIDDVELHVDTLELPRSHSITTFTDTAYLHLAMQTVELRIRMCSLVNSSKRHSALRDTFDDEDALREHLGNIPRWSDVRAVQATKLLELQMQQYVVVLHTPQALQVESRKKSGCRYSMITALEAAAATVNLHNALFKIGNYALVLTRNDYYRAMLLISHIAYYAQRDEDNTIRQIAKQIFDESQENALRLQEERPIRTGRGSEYFWYASAAISLVGTRYNPSQSEAYKRQAVDRVAKLLYRELALHDDPTEETLADEIILAYTLDPTRSNNTALQKYMEPRVADSFADGGLHFDQFDLGDTSEYLMDDLWFLNIPPLDINNQLPPGI